MKTILPAKFYHSLLNEENGGHPVRLIKAEEATRLLPAPAQGACHSAEAGPRKNPEVRLVATGPDYCDLEIVCGCGDVTRFRCWNTPARRRKGSEVSE